MRNKVLEYLKKSIPEKINIDVFVPEVEDQGHYSTNVAFQLARLRSKSALTIAEEIMRRIKEDSRDLFDRIEIGGAGFINFWISKRAFYGELGRVLKRGNEYGKLNVKNQSSKVQIEFVSANPTGPLTMANGRGGFLGDVLARVLQKSGKSVQKEYYINDAGNQIKLLGESLLAELGKISKKEEHYQGDYVKDLARKFKVRILKISDTEEIGRLAAAELLKKIKKSIKNAGIEFDKWYSEYENLRGPRGLIQEVLEILEKDKAVVDKDGARWLKTSEITDEKDRVLVKSNGEPTYFLSDLAYHYDKFLKRKFDLVIDIWGADHHGYVARLKSGVGVLGIEPERLKIIITQLVRLVEGGKEVRMSKRKGDFVTLDELIGEVGRDAARFFFLMHSPGNHMDFDLALAKERSQKNPVYYVQYAYVRCVGILRRSRSKKSKSKLDLLNTSEDLILMRSLVRLPEVLEDTARDYQVHRLTRYAMDLARAFHNFYEKERILGEENKDLARARLVLVSATKIVLENLFGILGISAPKRM